MDNNKHFSNEDNPNPSTPLIMSDRSKSPSQSRKECVRAKFRYIAKNVVYINNNEPEKINFADTINQDLLIAHPDLEELTECTINVKYKEIYKDYCTTQPNQETTLSLFSAFLKKDCSALDSNSNRTLTSTIKLSTPFKDGTPTGGLPYKRKVLRRRGRPLNNRL